MENLSGKEFGAYRIVAPLGEGGMASVYKAYQASMDRYVALKILPRFFANDPNFVHRFEREAKVIAQLEHPHILPVHDYGESEGYTYLVMRFVKGGDLAGIMTGEPLNHAQICKFISEIASALDYAHGKGVIHRDIKPSNVLIDDQGNCLLSDFGLAKMTLSDSKFTASGAFIGTPTYASPEQCIGQELDSRSDIYSLGVMLYEMYTGRLPFRADTPMGVVFKHVNDPLPMPRTINPQLSEAVERVILKALAKKPEDRYQTAGELAAELRLVDNPMSQPGSMPVLDAGATVVRPAASPPGAPAGQKPVSGPTRGRRTASPVLILGCIGAVIIMILVTALAGIYGLKTLLPLAGKITSPAVLPTATLKPVMAATLAIQTGQDSRATPTAVLVPSPLPKLTLAPELTTPSALITPSATPQPAETWMKLPGLPSSVNAVVIDPQNPQVVFAGTGKSGSGSGVYRSDDGGLTWQRMSNGLPSEAVVGLVFASQDSSRLYAVVEDMLYASDDRGENWTRLSDVMGSYSGFANRLVISADGKTLFALPGSAGIFRSTNQGAAWQPVIQGLPQGMNEQTFVQSLAVAASDPSIVYTGTGERWEFAYGVYKSTDGGQTWAASNQGMLDIGITALAVDPTDANVVYAGAFSGELYKSIDGGQTWQTIIARDGTGFSNSIYGIQINPQQPEQVFIMDSDRGVLESDDGGITWTLYGKPTGDFRLPYELAPMAIAFGERPAIFIGSESFSLWLYAKSDFLSAVLPTALPAAVATLEPLPGNGKWDQLQGLPNTINSALVDPTNPQVIYVGTGENNSGAGIYKSEDGGETWGEAMNGLPRVDVLALAVSGETAGFRLYALVGEGLYFSDDAGASWQQKEKSFGQVYYIENLAISPDGRTLMTWYGGSGLYHSTDGGGNWLESTQGLPEGERGDVYVDSIAFDPSDPSVVYAGTGYNHQLGNGVFKSTDGGQTWTAANKDMLDCDVTALAIDPQDPQVVYAGVDGGDLYKSVDGGQSWAKIRSVGQPFSNWVRTLVLDPETGRLYMVTNQEGLMASGDGGLTWQIFGRPGEAFADDIKAVAIAFGQEPVFYISTRESGFWRYTLLP
ncbi:MAG: hypothetical protein EHM70_01625 [Chloroflexota bacterium]|nr:MAG: hypothetical protein EHM70_01625 [Chloroflexota bacterium]